MSKLETAKDIIRRNIDDGKYGIFNCRNIAGDPMTTIHKEDGLQIDICFRYEYFEVFGLSDDEFSRLVEYYTELCIAQIRFEKVISNLKSKYEEAQGLSYVINPLAWALYQVWKEVNDECDYE